MLLGFELVSVDPQAGTIEVAFTARHRRPTCMCSSFPLLGRDG
jgi:hypothetical protein